MMRLSHRLMLPQNKAGIIGRLDESAYGVRFNFSLPVGGAAGRYERLGRLAEFNDENGALPWSEQLARKLLTQRKMQCCVVDDDVDARAPQDSVAYYLHPQNSNLRADGSPADITGKDGQVMVEIPKFYYQAVYDPNSPDNLEWWISPHALPGFDVHPAFLKVIGGKLTEVPFRYKAKYLGVLQNEDDEYQDYYEYTGEHQRVVTLERQLYLQSKPRLASVAGKLPVGRGTRAEFRAAARRRDNNSDDSTWRLLDNPLLEAQRLLMLTEFATFNSQLALTGCPTGGLVNLPSATWEASAVEGSSIYLPIVPNGGTETLGNASGCVSLVDVYPDRGLPVFDGEKNVFWEDVIPSYRGIENPYGHIWQWVEGMLYDFHATDRADVYVCQNPFSDTLANYERIIEAGEKPNMPSGYITRIYEELADYGFIPRVAGGSSITGLTDRFYPSSSSGLRVVAVGGAAIYVGIAGVFCVIAGYGSGNRIAYIGGRLCL
ncbi:MAG: hypothetical protein PHC50_03420 [Candidatus Cloacimonetes bacterium]|nr:hypothetical protein [Candidatus Cloacimonadota bacterium]